MTITPTKSSNKKLKIAVIGSGPSGVAASNMLLRRHDCKVDLIDVGLEMDEATLELKNSARTLPKDIILDNIAKKRALIDKQANSLVPQKLIFGSNFVYHKISQVSSKISGRVKLNFSFAKGGLGKVWGANISSILQKDINDWPISENDLVPYFKLLEEIIPVSAEKDVLGDRFKYQPLGHYSFPLSCGSKRILDEFSRNSNVLENAGLFVGRAKLAVASRESKLFKKCVSCGLCMHGCPHDSIFDPAIIIDKFFAKNSSFRYLSNNLIVKLREQRNGKVILTSLNIKDNSSKDLAYDKAFVACGSVGSTALIMRSFSDCAQKIIIRDSQKYLFPFIISKSLRKSKKSTSTNTLAQLVLQIEKLKTTSKVVHIQFYSLNDLVAIPLRKLFGKFISKFCLNIFSPILDRIMIGMMYLHSDISGHLLLKVNPKDNLDIEICGQKNQVSNKVFNEVKEKINHFRKEIGGFLVSQFSIKQLPGESQHFGASMPMTATPNGMETDILGRPFNLKNIHVIDTSILPSIPSSPTTLLVMANASRIAEQGLK